MEKQLCYGQRHARNDFAGSLFQSIHYAILTNKPGTLVHSISKCDIPIKTKASPWRFLDVALLFATHPF
ncbi:hypothetical protein, partial [Sinorhizobium meliloti]